MLAAEDFAVDVCVAGDTAVKACLAVDVVAGARTLGAAAEADAAVKPQKATVPTVNPNKTTRGAHQFRFIAAPPEWCRKRRDDTSENGRAQPRQSASGMVLRSVNTFQSGEAERLAPLESGDVVRGEWGSKRSYSSATAIPWAPKTGSPRKLCRRSTTSFGARGLRCGVVAPLPAREVLAWRRSGGTAAALAGWPASWKRSQHFESP